MNHLQLIMLISDSLTKEKMDESSTTNDVDFIKKEKMDDSV